MLSIKWGYYMDIAIPFSLAAFVYTHQEFVHPEYFLQDHILLAFIQGDLAVYAECDKGV